MKKRKAIKGLLFSLLILSLSAGCSKEASSEKDVGELKAVSQIPIKGKEWGNAPDFTLPKLKGGNLTLSSLKGKVIILDFWAVRCPPCRKEIPAFVELYKKYKDKGLEIIGICLDSEATVKPFAEKMEMNYPLVFGNQKLDQQYGGIRYIPTTFIIDKQGNITKKHIGYVSRETFEKEIKELL